LNPQVIALEQLNRPPLGQSAFTWSAPTMRSRCPLVGA
jgi:hypothetical protein